MKLSRCPSCHAHLNLDALIQDNNAKSLLVLVAKLPTKLGASVIGYVALFRPEKSDLSNSRAVKLIEEVIALTENRNALAAALDQTVTSIQAKRQQGTAQPLKNHSYLKKVLEGMKEQFNHPTMGSSKVEGSRARVKTFYEESKEVNKAMFEETQAKYRKG